GMTAEDVRHTEAYLTTSGQRLLESDEGMALFEAALKHQGRGFGVMVGLPERVEALLHPTPILADGEDTRAKTSAAPLRGDDGEQVKPLCDTLRELAGQVLGMAPDKIGPCEHLVEFGFDSIRLVEYARLISEAYAIQLTGASLLGRATIEEIASFLINEHALQHAETGQTADVPITDLPGDRDGGSPDEPIAVIGISGRFPGADTVSLFWDNLLAQRDCISDYPGDRPRWPEGETARGGYLADISRFDAALFHLSPHDACLMDPRQRLFLQEAWKAFEDAGYMGGSLRGSACGVYVGAEEGEYGYLAGQSGEIGSAQNADLAARVAHFFDLSGPNSAQSASCSSGLVALHSACQALRLKECEMALVGGVNLLLSPLTFTGMASMDLLSPCATTYLFDERANGMVPAEAVVALVLKPLSRALRDGDNIHGCIRASGVNSNGAGPGMMTPNPLRQAALIVDTCTRYRIRLGDLGYLMTHSIGSRFGDAAEIEGLNRAFDTAGMGEARCALGSVKPSIGHTFAASGIVSVIALLMAIKHRTIPGLPNYRHINPDIDLRSGRFILDARTRPWASEPECPRSGAVSSAGNNGTNAFAVIEEYLPGREIAARGQPAPPYIFVFSALTQEQLQESVERVLRFLQQADAYSPAEVAYTLQTGREGLPWRLAVIAATLPQLIARAREYLQTAPTLPPRPSTQQVWFTGKVEGSPPGIVADQHLLQASPEQIARRWVEGGVIPWHRSYADHAVRRVSLPGYPFAGERYWVMTKKAAPTMPDDADEHDLTGEALSVALEQFARGFFAEKLAIEATQLDINRTFRHYGVNSILLLRFMRACETRFRLTVHARKAVEYPTIASLVNFLALEAPAARQRETPAQYQDRKVLEAIEQYASGLADLETIRCLVQ
ncbi:MAG: beta-ketoacyl synthase N-terminal-like domain-containing protein, partial [Enterobacter roggenkampii]